MDFLYAEASLAGRGDAKRGAEIVCEVALYFPAFPNLILSFLKPALPRSKLYSGMLKLQKFFKRQEENTVGKNKIIPTLVALSSTTGNFQFKTRSIVFF